MGQEKRDKEGQAGLPVRLLGQSCYHRNKGPEHTVGQCELTNAYPTK